MITIEFFDANRNFVVKHIVEMEPMRLFPFLWAKIYCKAIFNWYKGCCFARVSIDGQRQVFKRNE